MKKFSLGCEYDHEFEGRNSRMDGLQAAILSVKLKYLPDWTKKRIKIANYYLENLKDGEYDDLHSEFDELVGMDEDADTMKPPVQYNFTKKDF